MILRPLKNIDAPLMLEWMHDDSVVHDLHRNFAEFTIDDCESFINNSIKNQTRNLHLAIAKDDATEEYMGTVSLKDIDRATRSAEFGITIRKCAMGTGYSKDAMIEMLKKGAKELGLAKIYWCVDSKNERALRFYDKNGYKRVALSDEQDIYNLVVSTGDYSKEEIDNYIWYFYEDPDDIDVSVYMLTYYHEKYIRQAIESVLAQKTNYKYELIISDDASQDGTVDIIKEYAQKHPDIIRINCNEKNVGIPGNIYKARTMCRGRYITNLSGDDYWINDQKIETETRFLDEHPEYIGAVCRVELRMDGSNTAYDVVPHNKSLMNKPYSIKEYEKCIPLGTLGLFMRNYFATEDGRKYFAQAREISEFVDDAVDEVLLLRKGPVYFMDIIADAHRVVPISDDKKNYNSRYSRIEKFGHHIELLNGMSSRWGDEIDFSKWYANYSATGILSMLASRDFAGYKKIFATIPDRYKKPVITGAYVRAIPFMVGIVVGRLKRNR